MAQIITPPVEETLKQYDINPELANVSDAQEAARANPSNAAGDDPVIPKLTDEQKEALAAELVQIDAALERLTERREAIKQIIRDQVVNEGYGTMTLHSEAGIKATIGHNSRLNTERFESAHPYNEIVVEDQVLVNAKGKKEIQSVPTFPNEKFYDIKPSPTKIKKFLAEDDWKTFYDEGEPTITIR